MGSPRNRICSSYSLCHLRNWGRAGRASVTTAAASTRPGRADCGGHCSVPFTAWRFPGPGPGVLSLPKGDNQEEDPPKEPDNKEWEGRRSQMSCSAGFSQPWGDRVMENPLMIQNVTFLLLLPWTVSHESSSDPRQDQSWASPCLRSRKLQEPPLVPPCSPGPVLWQEPSTPPPTSLDSVSWWGAHEMSLRCPAKYQTAGSRFPRSKGQGCVPRAAVHSADLALAGEEDAEGLCTNPSRSVP